MIVENLAWPCTAALTMFGVTLTQNDEVLVEVQRTEHAGQSLCTLDMDFGTSLA